MAQYSGVAIIAEKHIKTLFAYSAVLFILFFL